MSETKGPEELLSGIAPDVQKATEEAYGAFVEKLRSTDVAVETKKEQPKGWFNDPFEMLGSMGMGYQNSPANLTYETLRMVSEKNSIVAAIIATRVNQVASFARPQENKYSIGFKIRPRGSDKKRRLSESEKERIAEIEATLLNTGRDFNLGRDSFEIFVRKIVRDRLTYDQINFEKVKTYGNSLHSFYAVPADTIRIAAPKNAKGTPPDKQQLRNQLKYVQVLNGKIMTEYTQDEMAFLVANPRTHVRVHGYGFSEIELAMTTITSHLWAEQWNARAFSQGSTTKGVLNLRGNIPPQQLEIFKRQWYMQTAGIANAWKTPVLNSEGLEFIPLQMNNTEMGYQMWMEYLIKIISAIYQIDPAEVNFDLRGGAGQQPVFMSTNEAQQKVSKDRGLHPLLRFLEDGINKHLVWSIDPRFEFAFVGLDAKTEEQAMQLRIQQVQNIYTLNEVRAMEDLPPVKSGDMVLNPTYSSALMQASQQMPGGPPPGPGGEEEQDPNQEQPYQSRFDQQHADEQDDRAGDNVREAHKQQADEEKQPDAASGGKAPENKPEPVAPEVLRTLHINDWDSSIQASLRGDDLQKAVVYDTIDLD